MRSIEVDGQQIPVLGLGTLNKGGDEGRELVEAALAEGYRHIDTAQYYGSEEAVGKALARSAVPRSEVWITTKLVHPRGPVVDDLATALEESLRRLGTDAVELVLLHWPRPDRNLEDDLSALVRLREQGKARSIGVSNYPSALLREALELAPEIACDQMEQHVLLTTERVLAIVRERGMVLTAHCPLARGKVLDEPVVREIAAGHGCTPAQVALAWLVAQDRVTAVPGADGIEHLRENLGALEVSLGAEELAELAGLARRAQRVVGGPAPQPEWDEG